MNGETLFEKEYDRMEAKGMSYWGIKKAMFRKVDQDTTFFADEENLICMCGNHLTKNDFYCEKTDYICQVYYYCSKCKQYPVIHR